MPLYTVRVRLQPLPGLRRGANYVEMNHHLEYTDDDAALDGFPTLIQHWNDAGITRCWVVMRGIPVHQISLYRRDISDHTSWVRLAESNFEIGPLFDEEFGFEFNGQDFNIRLRECHLFPSARSAILVKEYTIDPAVTRRVYVGPVSPVPLRGDFQFPFAGAGPIDIGAFVQTWYASPFSGDYPFIESEDFDVWRPEQVSLARAHVAQVEDFAGEGVSVVPSWRYGVVHPVLRVKASYVRAELRSRSTQTIMSEPFDGG